MNTNANADAGNDADENEVSDGLDLTDREAELNRELENEGDGESGADADASDDADDAAGDDDADANGDDADSADDGATDDADSDGKKADTAGDDTARASTDDVPPPRAEDPQPEAEQDFDAAFKELERKYDTGELETAEYNEQFRALNRAEAAHSARVASWEQRQLAQQTEASHNFGQAAARWESEHKDFMSNPLRAQAMQQAIQSVDQQTGGRLHPAQLLERAQGVAFEAMNYRVAPAQQQQDTNGKGEVTEADKRKVAKAVADRQDKSERVPDIQRAPSAAPVDAGSNGTYAQLDHADIDSLEDAMAKMTPAQVEQYLADAPGASSRGN